MRKSLKTILAAGFFAAAFSTVTYGAGWEQTGDVWHYTDESGNRLKGWHNIKEENGDKTYWYYFDPSTGDMATGWKEIKEENSEAKHYYFFDEVNGAMWVDMITPDGSYVNSDGVWLKEGKPAESAEPEASKPAETEANETENTATETTEAVEETNTDKSEYADKLVSLINEKRRAQGLSEFNRDERLEAGAEIRAEELTISYSSLRPDGNKSKYAIDGWENYTALVEIKDRSASPEATMENWFKEGTSESLILTDSFSQGGKTFSFTDIGVGCKEKDGELYIALFLNGHAE